VSPPIIIAPVPRRATSESILASDSDQYSSRQPIPNTPLHFSTPNTLNRQLPLNGVPDTRNCPSNGGRVHTTLRPGHSRNNSGSSEISDLSTPSRKSARFSPNLMLEPPGQVHNPPPPGTTPIRSAMRQSPSPSRTSPQYRFHLPSLGTDPVPNIQIIHPTPPSPTSPIFGSHQSHAGPSKWPANTGGNDPDDSDGDPTPGQRMFRSSSRNQSPHVLGQSVADDSGYFSPHDSVLAKSRGHTPTTRSRQQSQRNGDTSSYQNQADGATVTNQGQPGPPSQVNQSMNQQRPSGSQIHTSWQAPRSPDTSSPVVPSFSWSLGNFPTSPVRQPYTVHTPARSARRSNGDLPRIDTSFSHTVAGQSSARPRHSHTQSSQHTPSGPSRAVSTPANESDFAMDSVVDNLLRVPASSVAWQTPSGVLTWTPHPGLPDSSSNLLGGGRESGGRVGSADWLTGGHPMPGACPTWTPGPWPPPSALATSRRAPIQLAPWMIPNPCNTALPHIMWDISQLPTTAKRITGNHVIVSLTDKLDDVATCPAVGRLVVVCQVGVAQALWGHIDVKASGPNGVTVWDVFNGIFKYFQKRVGRRELDRMKEMVGDELEQKMAGAFYQRVLVTPALPGYELKEGLKRVDCLGDACFFWGLYATYNDDNTWQLNLGLVKRRRYA